MSLRRCLLPYFLTVHVVCAVHILSSLSFLTTQRDIDRTTALHRVLFVGHDEYRQSVLRVFLSRAPALHFANVLATWSFTVALRDRTGHVGMCGVQQTSSMLAARI